MTYPIRWTVYAATGWLAVNAVLITSAFARIRSDRFASDRRTAVRLRVTGEACLDDHLVTLIDLSVGGALVRGRLPEFTDPILTVRFAGTESVQLRCVERYRQDVQDGLSLVSVQFGGDQEREVGFMSAHLLSGQSTGD